MMFFTSLLYETDQPDNTINKAFNSQLKIAPSEVSKICDKKTTIQP